METVVRSRIELRLPRVLAGCCKRGLLFALMKLFP